MNFVKFLTLALIGLAIRLWLVPQWVDLHAATDSEQFDQYAVNLLTTGTFSDDTTSPPQPNARRAPAYPLLLTTIYSVAGLHNFRAVQIVQAIIDLLTAWLVYRTARELFRDRLVGFWSFGTSLIAPPLLIFTGYVLTETLATFWTTLAVFCALKACRDNHSRWFIGLGISCGAAALTRTSLIVLPFFLLPAFFMTPEGRRFFTPKRAALAAFCGLFLFVPWVTRNAISVHEWTVLSAPNVTARGYHRWLSTWVDSHAYNRPVILAVTRQGHGFKPEDLPAIDRFPSHAFATPTEREKVGELLGRLREQPGLTPAIDAAFDKLALEKIHRHPVGYYVTLPLYRIVVLWAETVEHWFVKAPTQIARLAQWINIAIVAFGFGGMWVVRREWRDAAPLWLTMWACTISGVIGCYAAATFDPRFVAPAYPVMCIFASACAFHMTRGKSPLKTSTEIYEPDYERW